MASPEPPKPRLRGVLHQWAFYVSLVAGGLLVALAPSGRAAVVGGVYAVALAGMFGASALYHRGAWTPSVRPWLRRLDHSMIFVLIAGTSTPVTVLGLQGVLPVVVLAVVWGGALVGVLLKLVWIGAPRRLVASVYVVLGWIGIVLLPETARHLGLAPALLFVAGGAFYTPRAGVFMLRPPPPRPAGFGFPQPFPPLLVPAAPPAFLGVG